MPDKFPLFADLTLRDYFAAAALQGLLANPNMAVDAPEVEVVAYSIADDMLAERDEDEEPRWLQGE
jgi:hypothetical protein